MSPGHGLQSRTRDLFLRPFKKKGYIPLTTYLHSTRLEIMLKVNDAVHKGMPHKFYHDRTSRVWDVNKHTIGIEINKEISDFGLAKWLPDQWTHLIVSPIEGSFGYVDGDISDSSGIMNGPKTLGLWLVTGRDVFAFGILLLGLVTGRRAVDSCMQSLLMWVADPYLGDDYDPVQMDWVMLAASLCVYHLAALRPRMSQVVRLLKGEKATMESMGRVQHKSSRAEPSC